MRGSDHRRYPSVVILCCVAALMLVAPVVFAAAPTATYKITGSPTPGATVTYKATFAITDGSTLQSVKWEQVGGVAVTLAGALTDTITITLPDVSVFRGELLKYLAAPPMQESQLPAYYPDREFTGGLQNRWGVAGVFPTPIASAAGIKFKITLVTTSGTYTFSPTVTALLPYAPASAGLRNVPIQKPVLLQGKDQATYNWTLASAPGGSAAALLGATSRYPEFTPEIPGTYVVNVTDAKTNETVELEIYAGKWQGIIKGIDNSGLPVVDATCTGCHVRNTPNFDMFTPWRETGHAMIFADNVVNTAPDAHYSASCLTCHVVGYDTAVSNDGFDDAEDFAAFKASGLLEHGDPLNWSKIVEQFPNVARLANIQCENCHGPQNSDAHMKNDGSRETLASEVCASCHGRAPRHGRYQQWQLSGHGNYQLAVDEGTDKSCGKCHSAQGFLAWNDNNFSTADLNVTWTTDQVHPQTCVTCHDPHAVGTSSKEGHLETNAKMRVWGDTPNLLAGFKAEDVGNAAICMTCHNGRRGLLNDTVPLTLSNSTRAPHVGPQADVLMGQNLYFVPVGTPSNHSRIEDSCVTCHMEKTEAPSQIYSADVGTNHTFFANPDICTSCHGTITLESVQAPVEAKMEALKHEIEIAIKNLMQGQLRSGNKIKVGTAGPNNTTVWTTIHSAQEIEAVEFIESHGRQGVTVELANGTSLADVSLQNVKIRNPVGTEKELYTAADPILGKAGWNYFMAHSDKSKGVHNPTFVNSALDVSLFAIRNLNAGATVNIPPGTVPPSVGGGLGNFAGAVACTTPYVYWAEIAGRIPGNAGSQWRTDVITRNLGTEAADLKLILHHPTGKLEGTATLDPSAMKGFEDVVAVLGGDNTLGALEICSNQPLLVNGRIFNDGADGTVGQNIDGHVADLGYGAGQTVHLIGLRQSTELWRSNLIVTNSGTTEAQVSVTLFDTAGASLHTYAITVPAGQVINDTDPFLKYANQPDLGWGFATVTVVKGSNVHMMASVIDRRTNDATTIPPKQ